MQRPFRNDSGSVFLKKGELQPSNGIFFGNTHIPHTNERVMKFYGDAAESQNALLLDITNPRVNADNNVTQKATLVQRYVKKEFGRDIAAVINIGEGLSFRLPGKDWVKVGKKFVVKELLDSIESGKSVLDDGSEDEGGSFSDHIFTIDSNGTTGFKGPIFLFGFSLMKRGMSCRSGTKVPTHVLMHQGNGHNIENSVQTLGRGTFIGRQQLNDNGFDHVKVLMPEHDFIMIQSYQLYVQEVEKRTSLGENVFDAMSGALSKLPADTNYLQWTTRRTGMYSKSKPHSFDSMHNPSFEVTEHLMSVKDGEVAEWLAEDENQECYRTAKICRELWAKDQAEFVTDDIVDAFNDHYADRDDVHSISRTAVIRYMKEIKKAEIIREKPCLESSNKRYDLERHKDRMCRILVKAHYTRKARKADKASRKRSIGDFRDEPLHQVAV